MSRSAPKPSGRAVAYLRVSTDQQAASGLGLEAQQAAVTAAAARFGLVLDEVFTDAGTSGSLSAADRPILMDAIVALKRGDVLLVAKRDRLGRDVYEVLGIQRLIARRGARVVSAAGEGTDADSPSDVLMRGLIDQFAQYERHMIAARTKAALQAKRARGERVSRFPPFGFAFTSEGRLQPVEDEQATLRRIAASRSLGLSMAAIAQELNQQGMRTRAGSPWRFEYVRNLLGGRAVSPSSIA